MRRFGEARFSPARVWAMLLRYHYTALHYSILTTVAGLVGCVLVALLIDNVGRRICITASMVLCSTLLFLLAGFGASTAERVLLFSAGSALFVFAVNMALYVYTAKLYPTRMRALGCAFGGAAGRVGISSAR